MVGMFDQDVNEKNSLKYPKLYTPGLQSTLFNKLEFARSALQGVVSSLVLFFICCGESFDPQWSFFNRTYTNKASFLIFLGAYFDKITSDGISLSDQMLLGSVVATNLVVVVTSQVKL